ncbi:MAG: YcaO-like family protein [Nostoc sp.]
MDWTPVWSLTHQEFKYLPTAYCYYGYQPDYKPDCWADSNGCAAGNTLEEAILQGFMELVERDAVALWWYNFLQKPQVDLDSFDEPYFQSLKQYYQTINREIWVLDITSDLNIPVFAAVTRRSDRSVEDIVLGYGAHFDAKIAISRALTEVNQILLNVLFTKVDGSTNYPPSADRLVLDWWKTATLSNQPYLVPDERIAAVELVEVSTKQRTDLSEQGKINSHQNALLFNEEVKLLNLANQSANLMIGKILTDLERSEAAKVLQTTIKNLNAVIK